MNLSVTELILSVTGLPFLSYNSFLGRRSFGRELCELNAFAMTYLGEWVFDQSAIFWENLREEFGPIVMFSDSY